jgi:uncharacterized delta-60 repeat protein
MRLQRLIGALAVAVVVLALNTIPASAAPGDLDHTFSGDGKVRTDEPHSHGVVGVAVQSDGKILALGDSGRSMFVLRYRTNGAIDTSFGSGGGATVAFLHATDVEPGGIALAPGGRIVVVGTTFYADGSIHMATAVFTPGGVLDTSFSGDGRRVLSGSEDRATAVAARLNGKIVVAGDCGKGFAVAQLLPAGTLDHGFGTLGRACVHHGITDEAFAVGLDGSGRVIVGGENFDPTNPESKRSNFLLARFTTAGALDHTFSTDGWVGTRFSPTDHLHGLVVVAGSEVVAVGDATPTGAHTRFALAKYTSAGALDTAFGGGDGKVTTRFGTNDSEANAVVKSAGGRLVVVGSTSLAGGGTESFAVARYFPLGALDGTFGVHGKVTTPFAFDAAARGADIDPTTGRIVAGGAEFPSSGSDPWVLARYLA